MIKLDTNTELLNIHKEYFLKRITEKISNKLKTNYNSCLDFVLHKIDTIISGNVEDLRQIIKEFNKNFPDCIKSGEDNSYQKIFTDEYNKWTGRKSEYNAYEFVVKLGIKSCPYCNRNYTFVVNHKNRRLRPEIDHFFPKSIYPFLALSFYNLIPSCSVCNHTKGNKDSFKLNLKSPYEIEKWDFKFSFKPYNVDFFELNSNNYILDNFDIYFQKGIDSNIELFLLKELYAQHKDIVVDLLIKKRYYPESYIESLKQFGFGKNEIYRYVFNNYMNENDFHKRVLSKITKDITDELKIERL